MQKSPPRSDQVHDAEQEDESFNREQMIYEKYQTRGDKQTKSLSPTRHAL